MCVRVVEGLHWMHRLPILTGRGRDVCVMSWRMGDTEGGVCKEGGGPTLDAPTSNPDGQRDVCVMSWRMGDTEGGVCKEGGEPTLDAPTSNPDG